jgi:parvulin-like peptidyl-prolyl isomerase
MLSRQAIWQTLASAAILAAANVAPAAQPAKTPPSTTTGSVPIIPVSLTNEQIAATVNGEKILVGDVRKILDARPYPLSLTEEQKKEMRKAAIDALVQDALMRHYLAKEVPQVSQVEFNKEVQDLMEGLKKKNMTLEMFYKESGQNEEQLRRDIVAKLQWRVLLQRRLPDAEAKKYYDANKPFFDKVFVRASHILIKLPATPTKEQRDKVLQQMLVWRQDIVTGKATFESIAKQYSQCPTKDKKDKDNRDTPGDIGEFPYKFVVVPEFARVAYSLNVGDISEPVQTVFGIHLIKVTGRTKGEPSTFEPLKETVREVWAQDEDLFESILTSQRKASDIKIMLQ